MADFLTKRQESLLRLLSTRHGRKGSNYCFCDGIRSGGEILSLRPDLVEYCILRKGVSLPVERCGNFHAPEKVISLEEKEFARIADTVNSQGMLVVARRPEETPEDAPLVDPFALVLDRIGDPGNMGTILRTARAAGLKEVFLTKGCADPFSAKVIRSASGAQFALHIRQGGDLCEMGKTLQHLGVKAFFRTTPGGGKSLYKEPLLFTKSAIVMGSEGGGADPLPGAQDVIIPMPGDAESLNVAQAATIVLFEYVRRLEENTSPL